MKIIVTVMVASALGVALTDVLSEAQGVDGSSHDFRIEAAPRAYSPVTVVEGYLHNPRPTRLTNVRLRVEVLGADGAVIAEAFGWVIGDVTPGGRGYFAIHVPAKGAAYRVNVLSVDFVSGGA